MKTKTFSFVTAKVVKAGAAALDKYYRSHKLTRDDYNALCSAQKHLKNRLQELESAIDKVSDDCYCMRCAPRWGKVLKEEFKQE